MEEANIIIKNCNLLTPDFEIVEDQTVVVKDTKIAAIGKAEILLKNYKAKEIINGKGKLLMPGLVDAHTHMCQQFLRGRTDGEYPMVWARVLVPFESSLEEEDAYLSGLLGGLEMIKSGTTTFNESGGVHMNRVADATIESGLRASLTYSTMDDAPFVPANMKSVSPQEASEQIEQFYRDYHGEGDGRIRIFFALRQVMTSTPGLIELMGEKAREYHTGLHIHLSEHRDEVRHCLQNYQKRPAEVFDQFGQLGPNWVTAHNVLLSENEIELLREKDVKLVHCPRANFGGHGVPKTPTILKNNISLGIASDGAASCSLSLFDEMRTLSTGLKSHYGIHDFDPFVITAKQLLHMATLGGASVLQLEKQIGSIEIGKKADLILIDIDQPHISPSHSLISTIINAVNSNDVNDSVIDGKIVMKDREVLTLDEEKILYESKKRIKKIAEKANI
ncbi:amidohydrolase family protein [Gracilibacillus sp. HCP3S3_G5_1]|uniref:amidohydrolase family protein n=1 Tax=unclassified Gracilibacillus TaxID=2625209 RepID=UPI003F8B51DC